MKRFVLRSMLSIALLLAPAAVWAQSEAVQSQAAAVSPGQWTPDAEIEVKRARMAGLALDAAAALARAPHAAALLETSRLELESGLMRDAITGELLAPEAAGPGSLPLAGVAASLGVEVALGAEALALASDEISLASGGVLRRDGRDTIVWTATFESPGARGLRLHLQGLDLPAGAELFVYGLEARTADAHGPYIGLGTAGTGDMWTHTVSGSLIALELRLSPEAAEADLSFSVSEVMHMGGPYFFPGRVEPQGETNFGCIVDVNCPQATGDWPNLDFASNGIGHFFAIDGTQSFSCTGSLVIDQDMSFIPYFLTANHCVDSEAIADTMEVFFRDVSVSCDGGGVPFEDLPRVLGAQLLSARSFDTLNDHSFLRLDSNPPPGSTFFGWTTAVPAPGEFLYRISHPAGEPQRYSRHETIANRVDCGIPHQNYVHSINIVGATRGGSSGSSILNFDTQILGQLFGACGTDPDNICDNDTSDALDGSFAQTFPFIESFLRGAPPLPAELKIPKRGGIKFDPRKPLPGQLVTVRIKVKNSNRKGTASNFFVGFWADLPKNSPPFPGQGGATFVAGPFTLGPRESLEFFRTFTAPVNPGKHFSFGVVDITNVVIEKKEGNNIRKKRYKVKNP